MIKRNPRSTPPPSRKLSREEAKEILLAMCKAADRPLLVGVAAIKLGVLWSLDDTEALLQELVSEGELRPITQREQFTYDMFHGYVAAGVKSLGEPGSAP